MKKTLIINLLVLCLSSVALSWGGRGHDAICETATHLVQEPGLKEFLKSRSHTMGHLCNLPDVQWRSLDGKAKAAGDPAHFVEPDILGLTPKEMPLDLNQLKAEWTGKARKDDAGKTIFNLPREMGSLWWRVDQFMRELGKLKPAFADAKVPANRNEEQDDTLLYNKTVYQFLTLAGLMGHFVGDASMPYHNTINYDGWKNGRGGIHAIYEEVSVSEMGPELQANVMAATSQYKKAEWLSPRLSTLEKMRLFSQISIEELKTLEKLDVVVKASEVKVENGMNLRTPAERKPKAEFAKKFAPLIVKQMARSSLLLAQLWDEAYRANGQPDLGKYKSFRYPLAVDFLFPDYE